MIVLFLASVALLVPCSAIAPKTMSAVVATGAGKEEGDFSKIKVIDHPVPQPGHGQVLIRVAASSINPVDWKIMASSVLSALTLLGPKVMGFDVAGTIEAVGSGCNRLKIRPLPLVVGNTFFIQCCTSMHAACLQLGQRQ